MGKNSKKDTIKEAVRGIYGQVATNQKKIHCPDDAGVSYSGYSSGQVDAIPEGACMGIGCGNPFDIAALKPGEVVLDLGCGGGFDVFYAAELVGEEGRVIGIDMTPDMIQKAEDNAKKGNFTNVEFHVGDVEKLLLPDASIDVVISNCVINLSPDKNQVFQETYRVLVPGGRLAVADIVSIRPLPDKLKNHVSSVAECVGGAASADEIKNMLQLSGFKKISVSIIEESRSLVQSWMPGGGLEYYIRAALIAAEKPYV